MSAGGPSGPFDDVHGHVVTVLEDGARLRAGARLDLGLVVPPTVLRGPAGGPDPLVEDDVLDLEAVRVRDEVLRDRPATSPVVVADGADEDVDRAAVVVGR